MKIHIKNALMALICAVMAAAVFAGCTKESEKSNELKGTQWVAIEGSDEDYSGLSVTYTLTFDRDATLSINVLWYDVAIRFSYDYAKPIITFSNGDPILDGNGASSWAMIAQGSDISLKELQTKLKRLTFSAIVNGNTLTFPEDFFDDGVVFTKVK